MTNKYLQHGRPHFDRGHYSLWTKMASQGRRWGSINANFWFSSDVTSFASLILLYIIRPYSTQSFIDCEGHDKCPNVYCNPVGNLFNSTHKSSTHKSICCVVIPKTSSSDLQNGQTAPVTIFKHNTWPVFQIRRSVITYPKSLSDIRNNIQKVISETLTSDIRNILQFLTYILILKFWYPKGS